MSFDQDRADRFANRLLQTMNEASVALMISIGHRTGLFDAFAELPSATSVQLAEKAGLNERYVREWLGAMTTGRIVDYDRETKTYSLPAEHSAFLTHKASPNNIAVFAQYIPLLGSVEDDIIQCFRQGGGVPYSRFSRFHEVMAEDSGQSAVHSIFDSILPLIPGITEKLQSGIDALDVGCGRGKIFLLLAAHFPKSRFTGMDLSQEVTSAAQAEANSLGLTNIRFIAKDLSRFDEEATADTYDFITTFDAIHDQANPKAVLRGICRSLRPDGVYMMQDIKASSEVGNNMDHPLGPFLYTVSCMHCMTVSLAQGGMGLGAVWGTELAQSMLRDAGFTRIDIHQLAHDIQNEYYVIQR